MSHSNAPLSVEGRRRLVARCADRPIAHVAAEMGISRACASKWVNRFRMFGEVGLEDRASIPRTTSPRQLRLMSLLRSKGCAGRGNGRLHGSPSS